MHANLLSLCSYSLCGYTASNRWWAWSLVEWRFMFLSPCIISTHDDMATLFTSVMDTDRCCSEKRLTNIHRIGHLAHLTIKLLFCKTKISHFIFSLLQEVYPQPPPQTSLPPIFKVYSSKSLTIQPNH